MGNLIDEITGSLGPDVARKLASTLGINEKDAGKILPQIAPMIMGGLKKQMQNHGGAERVDHILNKYGSADVLNNISGVFEQKAQEKSADPSLGGLLGESGVQASNLLSKQFNLDSGIAMKIIPMLAPIVLGALSNKRDAGGAGSAGLAALIDQDGDGNILDDVAGFLGHGLTGSGSGQKKGGLLGGLLGSILGRKGN